MTPLQLTFGTLAVGLVLSAAAAHGARGEARVPASAEGVSPILVGAPVPDGALRTADGRPTSLHALLDGRPTVLVFYRGHW